MTQCHCRACYSHECYPAAKRTMDVPMWSLVLLGEDDENDVIFTQRTLQKCGVTSGVLVLDTIEAMGCYLSGQGQYADRACFPLPRAVFLDVYLSYDSTQSLLRQMRSDPALQHIPAILLTGTLDGSLVNEFQKLGALRCLEKPLTPGHCAELKELLPDIFARPA